MGDPPPILGTKLASPGRAVRGLDMAWLAQGPYNLISFAACLPPARVVRPSLMSNRLVHNPTPLCPSHTSYSICAACRGRCLTPPSTRARPVDKMTAAPTFGECRARPTVLACIGNLAPYGNGLLSAARGEAAWPAAQEGINRNRFTSVMKFQVSSVERRSGSTSE